ncbi:MAG: hypothetical protein A2X84_13975 [Desulfuromonadaceae bacterium GWC2_58_13]|nr:MAG: hypothetical protein A2X84_13975 [Desulfuromonadaceae bacterium GWC2_58_13]
MSSMDAAETLMAVPLFHDCSRQSLARMLPHVAERRLDPLAPLQTFGALATETFLILEGEFELDYGGGRRVRICRGFLGEEAGIGMESYLATATAVRPSRVLAIPRDSLRKLAEETESVLRVLLASFADRGRECSAAEPTAGLAERSESKGNPRILAGWLLATLVPFAVFFLLRDSADIPSVQTAYLLTVISSAVVMWVFRLLPDFVPALFAVLGVVLLRLAPPEVALAGFASDTFFMALSIFALSVVTTTSGFSYRVLLWLLRLGPPNKIWYNLSLFIAGVILTPIVPTTNGRVAIVAPFFNDLAGTLGKGSCASEKQRLAVSVLSGISLLSPIFMSAKSINFVIFGFLPLQEQAQFQWVYWFYAASVCGLALTVLYLLLAWLLFRNSSRPTMSRQLIADQLRILGRMKSGEWAALLGLLLMLAAVLTVPLHGVEVPWITFGIMYVLLMFGFLGAREFRKSIDWSFLVYLGALISLVGAIRYVGADAWFTGQFSWLTAYMREDFKVFILLLAAAIFLVRLALPINATVVVFATFLMPAAVAIGVNPWLIGFLVLLLAESFIWPFQSSYYLQFASMTESTLQIESPRLALFHALLLLAKLAAIYASFPFWHYLGIL